MTEKTTKVCRKCGRELPLSDFYPQVKKNKAGEPVTYWCSPCRDCSSSKKDRFHRAPVVVKRDPVIVEGERRIRHVGTQHTGHDRASWEPSWFRKDQS